MEDTNKMPASQYEQGGEIHNQEAFVQAGALEACQMELKEWKDKALTLAADFDNYKKRLIKERQQLREQAIIDAVSKLLPHLDNFERALSQGVPENSEQVKAWKEGLQLIYSGMNKALEQLGVTEITDLSNFNPELHEAVMSVVAEGHEHGSIVALIEKGYKIGERVIRPAKVTVAQ